MNTTILILGIVETLVIIVGFFLKKQHYFIITAMIYNLILLTQYILQGFYVETSIIAVSIVKNIILFIYAKKELKPNLYVLIGLGIALITTSIIFWKNWFSIFLLLSSLLSTFAAWQRNMFVLRICYCFCSLLLMTNYYFTGLYTTIIAEYISLSATIVSIVIYHLVPYIKKRSNK